MIVLYIILGYIVLGAIYLGVHFVVYKIDIDEIYYDEDDRVQMIVIFGFLFWPVFIVANLIKLIILISISLITYLAKKIHGKFKSIQYR